MGIKLRRQLTKIGLAHHYDLLWKESLQTIEREGFDYDPLLGSSSDNRLGITLLIRPNLRLMDAIQPFMEEIREIEPDHHFYPYSDIHVTVMPIISCYGGFRLERISPPDYIHLLEECLTGLPSFDIQYKGVTASPSCLMIKGFPSDGTLDEIRNRLRKAFKNSSLEQSLDKRYPLQTAHSTVIRFKHPVKRQRDILQRLDRFKDFDFGKSEVGELELVFNDWYQRKEWVQKLYGFRLGKG